MIGLAGDVSPQPASTGSGNRLMAPMLLEAAETLIYAGADILREDYSHLQISRSVSSITYIPLLQGEELIGAAEILRFQELRGCRIWKQSRRSSSWLRPQFVAAESTESQRQDLLDSVHRMSQLYDLEKSLNATLEFDAVTELIPDESARRCCRARRCICGCLMGRFCA